MLSGRKRRQCKSFRKRVFKRADLWLPVLEVGMALIVLFSCKNMLTQKVDIWGKNADTRVGTSEGRVSWLEKSVIWREKGTKKKGKEDASDGLAEKKAQAGDEASEKKIAITFDDGPHPVYTERLLKGLKERNVKATFFVVGGRAQAHPEIIERMEAEGHIVGNHTYTHIQLRSGNRQKFKEELLLTNEVISKITGKEVQYVRPPYGTWDKKLEEELNMFPVLWSIDPNDWCTGNAEKVTKRIVDKARENGIILLHDCYRSSVDAALAAIDILKERGFVFVTVEEILFE